LSTFTASRANAARALVQTPMLLAVVTATAALLSREETGCSRPTSMEHARMRGSTAEAESGDAGEQT
jgi:hypothetical protein